MKKQTVTCRYGITYTYEARGSYGQLWRLRDMLSKCCCFVCYNRDCKEPRDERVPECDEDVYKQYCGLFTKKPYCQRNKQKENAGS